MLEEVAAAAQGQEASLASRLAEAEGRAEAADAALAASLQKQTVRRSQHTTNAAAHVCSSADRCGAPGFLDDDLGS